MFHIKDSKHQIIHSLKIVRGHIDSIIGQAESDKGCFEVLHQVRAVEEALHKVDLLVIQRQLLNLTQDERSLQNFTDSLIPLLKRDQESSSLLNVPTSKIKIDR